MEDRKQVECTGEDRLVENLEVEIPEEISLAIGVKKIGYKPKTYGQYAVDKYGDDRPKTDLPDGTEGYEVHYMEQDPIHVSWSPKEVFDNAYFSISGLSHGEIFVKVATKVKELI